MAKYRSGTKQLHLIKDEGPSYDLSSQGVAAAMDEEVAVPQGPSGAREAWAVDQLAKSEFFHQKLHEWGMLEVANLIDLVRGEELVWGVGKLGISEKAWARVIHRGIKPVTVFAHPDVLIGVPRAVAYYRMLAMVSQKSMARVGLTTASHEVVRSALTNENAAALAGHLNRIISNLVEADESVDPREFDLWRGMAAGSQAQGSWGNAKGDRIEIVIRGILRRRIREMGLAVAESDDQSQIELQDGRIAVFADEPDFAIYRNDTIVAAIEIKGGIDTAGVLERVGAAVKSLGRARRENPEAVTILVIQGVSMTHKAYEDLEGNRDVINRSFLVEDVLDNDTVRDELLVLLGLRQAEVPQGLAESP
jgi:hypothetical protein